MIVKVGLDKGDFVGDTDVPIQHAADYGQRKVTVSDPTGFRAGMGVVVTDDRGGGWHDTLAAITLVQGNVLYLDKPFLTDYDSAAGGLVFSAFPLVAGIDLDSASIEGLCLDGNRSGNLPINGCIGGGLYLHRARHCRIADCVVQDFAGRDAAALERPRK